jgi:hypothetical protein
MSDGGFAGGKAMMKPLPAGGPAPQIDDDQEVPEELIGRLYRATESSVFEMLPDLTVQDRAYLAMFCYRKSHLHRIGLAIAATCDENVLVQTWGTALGQTLFAQSREAPPVPARAPGQHRSKITLATLGGASWMSSDVDDDEEDEAADDAVAFVVPLN